MPINISHEQSVWVEDTAGNKVGLREELKSETKVEALKSSQAVALANTYLTSPIFEAGQPYAASFRGSYLKKTETEDRTAGTPGVYNHGEILEKTLAIDTRKKSKTYLVDPVDENAYTKLESGLNTAIINGPITEIDNKFFLTTAAGATAANFTLSMATDINSKDFTDLINDSIVALKSKVDDLQSGFADSDLVVVMTYKGLSLFKETLTAAGTGSERQATLFENSLESSFSINGIPIVVSNRLPSGVMFLTMTRGEFGATATKVNFNTFSEKAPGLGNDIMLYSHFDYGCKIVFGDYVYGGTTSATQPTI